MADKVNLGTNLGTTLGTKRVVELEFGHRVTRDELVQSLDRIIGLAGCAACGLQGIDLNFKSKIRLKEIIDLPSLVDARITERVE